MVFNPQMNTNLSSPQIIGGTGAVQAAAPSGAAIAMTNFANLAKGFGDAWVSHQASQAPNAPGYGERVDLEAQEILAREDFSTFKGMVPNTAAGYGQIADLKRQALARLADENVNPAVIKRVAEAIDIQISGGMEESDGQVQYEAIRADMVKPENLDLYSASIAVDEQGNYDPDKTMLNYLAVKASEESLRREADRVANQTSIATGNESLNKIKRTDFSRRVETHFLPIMSDAANGVVRTYLASPDITADVAMSELNDLITISTNKLSVMYSEAGIPQSEAKEYIDAIMKPMTDLRTLVEQNIDDSVKFRAAMDGAQRAELTRQFIELAGAQGAHPDFQRAVMEQMSKNEGLVNSITSTIAAWGKDGVAANYILDGFGNGKSIPQIVDEAADSPEPLHDDESAKAAVRGFGAALDISLSTEGIGPEAVRAHTANLALATQGRVLGDQPLRAIMTPQIISAYGKMAVSNNPEERENALAFVAVAVKQIEVNRSRALGLLESNNIPGIIEWVDGAWALTGLPEVKFGRAGPRRVNSPFAESDITAAQRAVARMNFIEQTMAQDANLSDMLRGGGELPDGITRASAGRAANAIDSTDPVVKDPSDTVQVLIEAGKVDLANQIAEETAATLPADPAEVNAAVSDAVNSAPAGRGVSDAGVDFIKGREGLSLSAYSDAGSFSIGYGHTKTTSKEMTIDEAKAEELLRSDLADVEAVINSAVKVQLSQGQYDAISSFIYNVGGGAFRDSTLLRKLNAGDYEGAAREFLRWNKSQGQVLDGLTKRRQAEMEMFLGSMPEDAITTTKLDGDTTPVAANEGDQATTTGPAPQLVDVDFANGNGVPMTSGQIRVFSSRKEAEQAVRTGQIKRGDRILLLENGEQVILEVE